MTPPPDTSLSTPAPPQSSRFFLAFLLIACIAACTLVVILARQNQTLRAQLAQRDHQTVEQLTTNALPIGTVLDSLESFAPAAESPAPAPTQPAPNQPTTNQPALTQPPASALTFDDGRLATLLFIHSSTCPACEEMLPAAAGWAARVHNTGIIFVGLQIDARSPADLKSDLKPAALTIPIRGVANPTSTWLKRVEGVPVIVLVGPSKAVLGAWWGVLDTNRRAEVDRAIESILRK